MGKGRKRVPQNAQARPQSKEVRVDPHTRPAHPSWRFSTIDRAGPFAWPENDPVELQILRKLHSFDSMEWSSIEGSDHHSIEVSKLSREAVARLQDLCQDDIDAVFSFHFSGRRRIIGIRDVSTVKLLWWDPEHGVCPSAKKHT